MSDWSWDRATKNFGSEEEDNGPSTWDQIKSGASAGWNWVTDTAAPAVGTGVKHITARVTPFGWAARGYEYVTDEDLSDSKYFGWAGELSDTLRKQDEEIVNFGKFAYENPERATALAVQGTWNGVTSLGGFAGDLARGGSNFILTNMTPLYLYNRATEFYADGLEDAQREEIKQSYIVTSPIGPDEFFGWSTALGSAESEFGAIQNWDWLGLSDEWKTAFKPNVDPYILDENGKKVENPNAAYERVLLYGPQAISEIVVFAGISAVTGGAGGLLLGAARLGKVGVYAPKIIKAADEITDIAKDIAKYEKKLGKLDDVDTPKGRELADKIQDLKDQKALLEEANPSAVNYLTAKELDSSVVKLQEQLIKEKDVLQKLKDAGGSADEIIEAEAKIVAMKTTLAEQTAQLSALTEQAAQAGHYVTASTERAANGMQTYAQKGLDFGNPLKDGAVGKTIEGGMIPGSMALSIDQDLKEAEAENQADNDLATEAASNSAQSANDAMEDDPDFEEAMKWQKEQEELERAKSPEAKDGANAQAQDKSASLLMDNSAIIASRYNQNAENPTPLNMFADNGLDIGIMNPDHLYQLENAGGFQLKQNTISMTS